MNRQEIEDAAAALDRDLAKDQIKRLEEALQRQDNAIIAKDAEIECLKFEKAHMASNDYVYSLTSEIERLKNEILELGHRVKLSEYQKLQSLCTRVAAALSGGATWIERDGLIDELRKAAE
jgi:hypothetical protein